MQYDSTPQFQNTNVETVDLIVAYTIRSRYTISPNLNSKMLSPIDHNKQTKYHFIIIFAMILTITIVIIRIRVLKK